MYQYSYLIGTLSSLLIWLILFFWRKDTRKEMLIISLLFGLGGLIVDPIYSSDWWSPQTITGTVPGIESFIFGFSIAGIASIIYVEAFNKRLKIKKANRNEKEKRTFNLIFITLLSLSIFLLCFFILRINSYFSTFPALLFPIILIWTRRKDLIPDSLISAVLLVILAIPFYIIPETISPGWIDNTWNWELLSGLTFLKIPLEDLIWFFLSGLLIGPLYEYWQNAKLTKN